LNIVNLRKKVITVTVSVSKKELLRSDTVTASPKSIEIKPTEKGKLTLVFHATDNSWPITYSSLITLMLEMEGKKKKVKCTSSYFVYFTAKSSDMENNFPISARGSFKSNNNPNGTLRSKRDLQILEFIGGGGSGAVVHKCIMNGNLCAVKILDVSSTPDSAVENFIKEIKLIESKSMN
jgi:hypothetical protein